MDTRGLVDKYQVHRKDGRPLKGGGAIVLEVGDPKTWPAIAKLADSVEAAGNSIFASELRAMLDSMGAIRSLDRYRDEPRPGAMAAETPPGEWGRLELMGHLSLYGRVSEVERFGEKVIKIEALDAAGALSVYGYYGGKALYGFRPMTEERVRALVRPTALLSAGPSAADYRDNDDEVEGDDA